MKTSWVAAAIGLATAVIGLVAAVTPHLQTLRAWAACFVEWVWSVLSYSVAAPLSVVLVVCISAIYVFFRLNKKLNAVVEQRKQVEVEQAIAEKEKNARLPSEALKVINRLVAYEFPPDFNDLVNATGLSHLQVRYGINALDKRGYLKFEDEGYWLTDSGIDYVFKNKLDGGI